MNKISAAIDAGCRRFDGAIRGIGGCPFAQDALVGNAPTERMIELFENLGLWDVKNKRAWSHAQSLSAEIFSDKK
jgi:hydroxymethylglutaryl-CoA lyase